MRVVRFRNKTYVQIGPLEIQYGHLSHTIAVFKRHPWRRLFVLAVPHPRAAEGSE